MFNDELVAELTKNRQRSYAWESHIAPGMKALQSYPRRDNPTNRQRWQFSNREEHLYMETLPEQT